MVGRTLGIPALIAAVVLTLACDRSPASPSSSLPFVTEAATTRYYYEAGDTVEVERQEAFNAWAIGRLEITPPRKVEYRKYLSREAMGRYTGNSNTNGFAEPESFRIHTIWSYDNHEIVHVYTAIVGRPSDFFNEGIAVSFQTDPARGDLSVKFNGQQVHDACKGYLSSGQLPLPVSAYATTSGFRNVQDTVLSYRVAGSFVLHLTERFGLPAVLRFFQGAGGRDESLDAIRTRMQSVFGVSLENVETSWLAMLRS